MKPRHVFAVFDNMDRRNDAKMVHGLRYGNNDANLAKGRAAADRLERGEAVDEEHERLEGRKHIEMASGRLTAEMVCAVLHAITTDVPEVTVLTSYTEGDFLSRARGIAGIPASASSALS